MAKLITTDDIIKCLKDNDVYEGGYADQEHVLIKKFSFDFKEAHKWLCQVLQEIKYGN